MNKEQKQIKRVEEINGLLSKGVSIKLLNERSDIEFAQNKKNINITLKGNNKYYYAHQCAIFTKNLLKHGYGHINKEEIQKNGVCFNKYSINNGYNQYCRDIKRFSSKEEMIGFVIGYNFSINNTERKK